MESTKTKRVWRGGPPPHIGWWNASVNLGGNVWRWWDGARWSVPYSPNTSLWAVAVAPRRPSGHNTTRYVQWTDYWPENARVPRMRPEDFEPGTPWVSRKTGDLWILKENQAGGGEYTRLISMAGRMIEVRAAYMGSELVPERCYEPTVVPAHGPRQELVDSRVLATFGAPAGYAPPRKVSHWAGLSSNEPCPLAGLPTTAFKEVV